MNTYKNFIYEQRRIDLSEAYIHLFLNVVPKLYEHLKAIEDTQFLDGAYHKFCGEIKIIVNNFIAYWNLVINKCVKEADTYKYTTDKKKLVQLIENSVKVQKIKQRKFLKHFLPTEDELEEAALADIEQLFMQRLQDYEAMAAVAESLDTQKRVQDYLELQCGIGIRKKNEFFSLCHQNIAHMLAHRSHRIRASLKDIYNRVRKNLDDLKEEQNKYTQKLMADLYEANKLKILVTRQEAHRITDTVEVESALKRIHEKLDCQVNDKPVVHLTEELQYWEQRLAAFEKIENIIKRVKSELHSVMTYLQQYESLRTTELPGAKKQCFETIGENLRRRKLFLEDTFNFAAKSIMTFLAIKGFDRIFYTDHVGKYAVDDFGHQIYVTDFFRTNNHVKCDGSYEQYNDLDKYFFDKYGRYVLDEDGEKLYQRASCGSTYKLNENNLFVKQTIDCGHSEQPNPNCKMNLDDPNKIELLPMVDQVDIRGTMTSETVKYLWDNVSPILPQVLNEIGTKLPRNPIYHMAHKIIKHKYHSKGVDLENEKKASQLYREKMHGERKEKAAQERKEWNAKQSSRCRPEDIDNSQNEFFYHYYKQADLLNQVNYEYNN